MQYNMKCDIADFSIADHLAWPLTSRCVQKAGRKLSATFASLGVTGAAAF